ncbi:MAG TPA: GGDEF domain-containing protein [Sphingomicrobium sp.]|jgi:diguanylate cyclase (GGDEF)-like protein|nr:GGDEF domain-containing protein [Sphingomicrobium sp.]
MTDSLADISDADRLLAEIGRLRAQIAQLEQRVEQLDLLAHQDTLVSLPNRRGFMRELEVLVDRARRYGETGAMLYVDLDGLKMINDTFGHKAGDEALIQVAQLLVGGVRRSDVVARIGGDEFGILLGHANELSAHETAGRLVDMIADCDFMHEGDALPLSVAIGVAVIGADDEPEAIMARADEEMYRRKAAA